MEKLTGMTEREMIMINFLTRRSIERIIVVDRMRVHVDEDLDNEDVMAWSYPDFRVWFYVKIFKITVTFSVLNLFVILVDHLEEILM